MTNYLELLSSGTIPKNFRVWDSLHHRWFQGSTSPKSLELMTDHIAYFGETLVMENTMYDQNEDDVWKKSRAAGEISSSLDAIRFLHVVQDTGVTDRTGRRIYEGDILELGQTRGFICYDRTRGAYSLYGGLVKIYCDFNDCKIIGNVLENPELLDEEE